MGDPVVSVSGLSKTYRVFNRPVDRLVEALTRRPRHTPFAALSDVTFSVRRGEGLGIIGENGAGKSTLLKILAGVTAPSAGSKHTEPKSSSSPSDSTPDATTRRARGVFRPPISPPTAGWSAPSSCRPWWFRRAATGCAASASTPAASSPGCGRAHSGSEHGRRNREIGQKIRPRPLDTVKKGRSFNAWNPRLHPTNPRVGAGRSPDVISDAGRTTHPRAGESTCRARR